MTSTASPTPLAERDPEELLTLLEAADILRASPNTMYWWRQKKTGPTFFKLGRNLVTTVAEVRAFIEAQRRKATS